MRENDQSLSLRLTSKPLSFKRRTLNFLNLTGPKYILFVSSGFSFLNEITWFALLGAAVPRLYSKYGLGAWPFFKIWPGPFSKYGAGFFKIRGPQPWLKGTSLVSRPHLEKSPGGFHIFKTSHAVFWKPRPNFRKAQGCFFRKISRPARSRPQIEGLYEGSTSIKKYLRKNAHRVLKLSA